MTGRDEAEKEYNVKSNNRLNDNNAPKFMYDWKTSLMADNMTGKSIFNYISKAILFLEFLNPVIANVDPMEITASDARNYMISVKEKITKDGTVKKTSDSHQQTVWSVLNKLFEFLADEGLMETNYMKKIKRPCNNDLDDHINKNRILLTLDDFKKILTTVDDEMDRWEIDSTYYNLGIRDLAILSMFMTCGMRCEALRDINIEDLDFENMVFYVKDKGNKTFEYPINDMLYNRLVDWIDVREDITEIVNEAALFISRRGKRIATNNIADMIKKYSKKALGYEITPHKFRSGLCSIMYEETKDIEFVRRAIGHARVDTTQRYIVTKNDERQKAGDMISSFLY